MSQTQPSGGAQLPADRPTAASQPKLTQLDDPTALARLSALLRKREVVTEILDKNAELLAPGTVFHPYYGGTLKKPVGLKSDEEIRLATERLAHYTYHMGDYIHLVAQEERGMSKSQADNLIGSWIKRHRSLQILGYLVNNEKHAKVTKRNPADDVKPTYGCILVYSRDSQTGMWLGFNPKYVSEVSVFSGQIIQTVDVIDKDGRTIEPAWWLIQKATAAWMELLEARLKVIAPIPKPLSQHSPVPRGIAVSGHPTKAESTTPP